MKYPAIVKPEAYEDVIVLVFREEFDKNAIHLEGSAKGEVVNYRVRENLKNITAEYLADTYGEVKSKEHAEFIVKLAEVNDFRLCNPKETYKKWFCFDDDELYFFDDVGDANNLDEKQITIPLPPECESVDEWPKVNDDVFYDGQKWTFVAKHNHMAMLFWTGDECCTAKISELQKPKTPEQELRDELIGAMDNSNTAFQYADYLSKYLIDHYDIKKKPQ